MVLFSRKDKVTFFGIRGRHLFLDSGSGLVLSTATLRPSFRARSQAETHCCQEPSMSWSSCAQTVKTNHYTHLRCFPPKLLNQIHLISCSWRSSSCVWVLSCGRYLNSLCSHTRSPLEWCVSGRTLIYPLQNSKEGYVIKKTCHLEGVRKKTKTEKMLTSRKSHCYNDFLLGRCEGGIRRIVKTSFRI